jgi:biopolymer transport protein ExbB/TolQ
MTAPFSVLRFIALALALGLAACASAPVQQMSDARQALSAAEQAGAPEGARDTFAAARVLLEQAQEALDRGDYETARERAEAAHAAALKAREEAMTQSP